MAGIGLSGGDKNGGKIILVSGLRRRDHHSVGHISDSDRDKVPLLPRSKRDPQ